MEKAHKLAELIPGKYYLVAHVKAFNGDEFAVFPNKHEDKEFSPVGTHYHFDMRFERKKPLDTTQIILDEAVIGESYLRKRKFIGRMPGSIIPEVNKKAASGKSSSAVKYLAWREKMKGKKCPGGKCPHRGQQMIKKNGKWLCPMHHLEGDIKKNVII